MAHLKRIPSYILYVFSWPYYGTLIRYTIEPLERIANPQKDLLELSECVQDFARGKAVELRYIAFAATINAALAVATFSWPHLAGAPWAVMALLYTSLFFTIGALVTGSQQDMFFHKMCPYTSEKIADGLCEAAKHNTYQVSRAQFWDRWSSSWLVIFKPEVGQPMGTAGSEDAQDLLRLRGINPSMILTWQGPIMLMAWAWVSYLVAIMVLISKPFMAPGNAHDDERNIAIFSLTAGGLSLLAFFWTSWFTYQAGRSFKSISPRARGLPK